MKLEYQAEKEGMTEEIYRVRRLMREEKDHKEDVAFTLDKERKAREVLEGENEELRVQLN